jgi:NADPH:quinone reductase-like Zn-dependent oxidoreductase
MSQQHKNVAAVLHAIGTPLVLEERPIPSPGDGEILVRNRVIAVNPVDWKRQAWGFAISSYPVILGGGKFHVLNHGYSSLSNFREL